MIEMADIKLVVLDVDGTLTDGIYQISEGGKVTKSFYTKDFYAIEKILRAKIDVCIVTQSHDFVIDAQVERIESHSDLWTGCLESGALQIFTCVEDKIECVHSLISNYDNLGWHNIAYMGDAENDVGCMKKALFTGCPFDAIDSVKENSTYISDFPGGRGAVYEFCMFILDKKVEKKLED